MSELISSMALAVLGIVFYHLAIKIQPTSASLFWQLAIAYCTAALISLSLCLVIPSTRPTSFSLSPQALLLGVAIVTAEVGYLLVYRSGWSLGIAAPLGTTAATLILLPVGILVFREKLNPINLLGLSFCTLGLFLTSFKAPGGG
jgi:drug/metabolite transporter (DMT)-like permease